MNPLHSSFKGKTPKMPRNHIENRELYFSSGQVTPPCHRQPSHGGYQEVCMESAFLRVHPGTGFNSSPGIFQPPDTRLNLLRYAIPLENHSL
ncbi:hypothetical protein LEMLEM_LOCUS23556 [Lemmus lemmus]